MATVGCWAGGLIVRLFCELLFAVRLTYTYIQTHINTHKHPLIYMYVLTNSATGWQALQQCWEFMVTALGVVVAKCIRVCMHVCLSVCLCVCVYKSLYIWRVAEF